MIPILHLRSGKDRPLRFGHPWIFSGALADLDPSLPSGSIVRVASSDGEILGSGYVNPNCSIVVRMLVWGEETVDADLLRRRVAFAAALRRRVVPSDSTAYRLINGEGDGLPGILADVFGDVVVIQSLTAGADACKADVIEAIEVQLSPRAVIERSEGSVRTAEGLAPASRAWRGTVPQHCEALENGLRFRITPGGGQKTGYFCDQRPNRALVRDLASGRRVLDAFSYTGGFAVHAGAGGAADVLAVDSSPAALSLAEENWSANEVGSAWRALRADVSRFLRDCEDRFDLIVLDPPALVRQRKDVNRGARAYKDINLWALRRAAPGAYVLTFTCSQHVSADLFAKIVLGAAADARRRTQLLQHLGPGPDHPIALAHPEGEYLHGLLLRVE
jgi:23S rRNA (cytosine1962-C5)-methyltransferase